MNRRSALIWAVTGLASLVATRLRAKEVGRRAPDFEVVDSQGRKRRLDEFAGKTLVLEWTSPSCPFVRAQYQSGVMQETQRTAAKQGVAWLSILSAHPSRRDYLPPDRAEAFHRSRNAASAALLLDTEGAMGRAYGAVVTPHLFIVDSQARLVYAGGTGDKATMDPKEVRTSRSFVRDALADLAAGRKVGMPRTEPFGCAIAYRG